MKPCVWYVSKYVGVPAASSAGGRGYLLMEAMAREGVEAVIITSDSNLLTEVPVLTTPHRVDRVNGLTMCWVRTLKYRVAKSRHRILSWLDFEWRLWRLPKAAFPRPDVVIVSSLSLLTVVNGWWLRWRYGAKLVVEIRDIWPLTIVEEGGFSPRNPLVLGLGWLEKLAYRRADAIVGTMPNLAAHVAAVTGQRLPVHCIPMGVDESLLAPPPPLPDDFRSAYLPDGKFIVAHVGSIGITNALQTFLDCARALRDVPDIHFLLVGDGDLRASYMADNADLPNLTFAPRVPKALVQPVLAACDVLYFAVHPSRVWDYGQSLNKVIDYMLAGKPIVASYTGYPSMINEADCGRYVPAGDTSGLREAILAMRDLPSAERAAMGLRGRSWLMAHRRYDRLARDYLAILFPDGVHGSKTPSDQPHEAPV